MTEPRLELVERFDDLRVSDVVVVKPCDDCGASGHRVTLIKRLDEVVYDVRRFGAVFEAVPTPRCSPTAGAAVTPELVTEGRVFRERLPDVGVTEETTAQRPKVRELEDAGSRRGTR